MKTPIVTFDTASKEVKTKISKLGKDALAKRFADGKLTSLEEIVVAEYYLLKRESFTQKEIEKFEATQYVDIFFPLEIDVEQVTEEKSPTSKKEKPAVKEVAEVISEIAEDGIILLGKPGKGKSRAMTAEEKATMKVVEIKEPAVPMMKLTEQEFTLFEAIKKIYKGRKEASPTILLSKLSGKFTNLREFKGVLGSLMKKEIISYTKDDLLLENTAMQMILGTLAYKQKAKNEQNFFKKERITVEIDGKKHEKSSFVRMRLRKSNDLTCVELNVELAELGFGKLYHSELQRCKDQLGIVTVKKDQD